MTLGTVSIEHIPSSYTVYLALYRDISNAAFLHQQLLDRNADFEYAFIDASVVVSRRQLLSAVFKAVTSAASGALKTPNVHSEIVVSLNPSNNIADSYRRFGISPSTKDLLIVKVTQWSESSPCQTRDSLQNHLRTNVQGSPVDATDANIATMTDLAKVRKYYKLNGLGWLDAIKDEKTKHSELDTLIVSSIALRGL
ncbi:hypothetical protein QQS21_006932 [Conoideocrella luteorostrata]|uniref:EKC/KEOPS complex subunit CGI121 n=1 Tax=Conoideocrella luteorostrata TaxID=1105319 RepID=A0AAJ0FSY6_9HYPO|nr:hypothetical protein QQS21_006932 [Conoideocrella luteorostrata]